MRCLPALLLATLSLPAAADCPWAEPKEPPAFTLDRHSGAELKFKADPKWFQCAKKAGGTLQATFEITSEDGKTTPQVTRKVSSYSAREAVGGRDLCAAGPGEKKVKVTLKGTGELSKLDFISQEERRYCPRCQMVSYDNSLVIHTGGPPLTPKGMFTLQGNVDEKWHACARLGSKLELRMYAGHSREEVLAAKEPTHVLKGLETAAKWKKAFDKKSVCQGGATHLAYELAGSGEMQELNYDGRAVQEISGRCKP